MILSSDQINIKGYGTSTEKTSKSVVDETLN